MPLYVLLDWASPLKMETPLKFTLGFASNLFKKVRILLFGNEICQNFVAENELNKNFTEKSAAYANLPSKFPIFPKFFPALKILHLCSQNCGLPL